MTNQRDDSMKLMDAIEEQGDFCKGFKSLFYQRIAESLHRTSSSRKKETHVSTIKHSCKRNRIIFQKLGLSLMRQKSIVKVWIGNRTHDFPVTEKHELRLEWKSIIGTVDEYEDGFLVDKKTTREIPKRPYSDHVKQVEYYRVLLQENGYPVMAAAVCYIDVNEAVIEVLPVNLKRSIETVKAEMLEARDELLEAVKEDKLPPRLLNWLCWDFCEIFQICFLPDKVIKRLLSGVGKG